MWPIGPRERLRGLPDPPSLPTTCQDIAGGVVVPMQARAALGAGMPAVRFPADGDHLGRAFKRTRPPDGDPPQPREDQDAIPQRGTAAKLLVGEAVVAVFTLEARRAGLFTVLGASQEPRRTA